MGASGLDQGISQEHSVGIRSWNSKGGVKKNPFWGLQAEKSCWDWSFPVRGVNWVVLCLIREEE